MRLYGNHLKVLHKFRTQLCNPTLFQAQCRRGCYLPWWILHYLCYLAVLFIIKQKSIDQGVWVVKSILQKRSELHTNVSAMACKTMLVNALVNWTLWIYNSLSRVRPASSAPLCILIPLYTSRVNIVQRSRSCTSEHGVKTTLCNY